VQTAYQRRNDLIGNLVNTVKELLILKKHWLLLLKPVQSHVYNYWSFKYYTWTISPFNKAQAAFLPLYRLLVSAERYPELKANQNFSYKMNCKHWKSNFNGQNPF
jgi:LemA protein